MVMNAVLKRCAEQSLVTVMDRLALQRALEPAWVDALFERECGSQCTWELPFCTTVGLMLLVTVGLRPSVHGAAKACKGLPVSVQALYDKIRHTSPDLNMMVDLVPCEDDHAQERLLMKRAQSQAQPRNL